MQDHHKPSASIAPRIHDPTHWFALALALGAVAATGCAASPACRRGPADDARMAARTTGEAVKTGAVTGVAGVKAAGRTAGGYVAGGSDEADQKWAAGKRDTARKANDGAAETQREGDVPACED